MARKEEDKQTNNSTQDSTSVTLNITRVFNIYISSNSLLITPIIDICLLKYYLFLSLDVYIYFP